MISGIILLDLSTGKETQIEPCSLRVTFLGEDFDYVSALQDMTWQPFLDRAKTWGKLRGGNDQLPRAFAERLGTRMRYGGRS
jgi:monoamine oxidase